MEDTLTAGFTDEEVDRFYDLIHRMQDNIKKIYAVSVTTVKEGNSNTSEVDEIITPV